MEWQPPTTPELLRYKLFRQIYEENGLELVTNGTEGTKCDDWTQDYPWVEAALWGYNVIRTSRDDDDAKFRCHFCKKAVANPKPYEAMCGTDSCEAYWSLAMMDEKKIRGV